MGWRSTYTRILERDDPSGITYAALKRVEAAMVEMPPADRIAMARELLEGTGCEVIDENGKDIIRAISYTTGYDAASEERDAP